MKDRRGLLIILSSPSGAGKSTLSKRLIAWDPSISFSVSATTRPPRDGETNGVDYHFLTEEAFKKTVSDDGMLEHAHVFGNFYGSPRAPVEAAIGQGKDVLFDIDSQLSPWGAYSEYLYPAALNQGAAPPPCQPWSG